MSEPDFRDAGAEQEAEKSADRDEAVTTANAAGADDEAGIAAAEGLTPREGVGEHYREMTERGANQQGEGQLP